MKPFPRILFFLIELLLFFPLGYLIYRHGAMDTEMKGHLEALQMVGVVSMLIWCFLLLKADPVFTRLGLLSLLFLGLMSSLYSQGKKNPAREELPIVERAVP